MRITYNSRIGFNIHKMKKKNIYISREQAIKLLKKWYGVDSNWFAVYTNKELNIFMEPHGDADEGFFVIKSKLSLYLMEQIKNLKEQIKKLNKHGKKELF